MTKQKILIFIFSGCAGLAVIFRLLLKIFVLEPNTGFFPHGSVTAVIFPLTVLVLLAAVIVSCRLLIKPDEIYMRARWQSIFFGIGMFFFAFSLMLVTAMEVVSVFGDIASGYKSFGEASGQMAFFAASTLCAIVCAYLSVSIATGSYNASPVSTLIPVVWQAWYLILIFLQDKNAVHISEQYLRLTMLCASLVSFYYFNRQFSDTWDKKMAPAGASASFAASLLAFALAIPALVTAPSDSYNFTLPQTLLHLSLGVMWLASGLYIIISKEIAADQ